MYGLAALFLPVVLFAYLPVLAASLWMAAVHAHGRRPWPWVPSRVRRPLRLAVELGFGLINPVLYLAILAPTIPALLPGHAWRLTVPAWALLIAFWTLRLAGAGLRPSKRIDLVVRTVLWASLACVAMHAVKDLWCLLSVDLGRVTARTVFLGLVRLVPLYAIPAVFLWDYARWQPRRDDDATTRAWRGLFLLPRGGARALVAAFVVLAAVTALSASYRRSDAAVRDLVGRHRADIADASHACGVDPRLLAAIVYVTHRDQLSPFRDALERTLAAAWATNLRAQLGLLPPDRPAETGTDENPLLNQALDLSIGIAQVKPRTAQLASVLASGLTPDELPEPIRFGYLDLEPAGSQWKREPRSWRGVPSPVAVPSPRAVVTDALLEPRTNLATAALILGLYQRQWEAADAAWSVRHRPDIVATLYQIGFAKSVPHASPRPNAFGRRVAEVMTASWLVSLFPPQAARCSTR